MCGSIFFRKVGRAMMKKENKKTEPDVKNNDRQKEKKSVKLGYGGRYYRRGDESGRSGI